MRSNVNRETRKEKRAENKLRDVEAVVGDSSVGFASLKNDRKYVIVNIGLGVKNLRARDINVRREA